MSPSPGPALAASATMERDSHFCSSPAGSTENGTRQKTGAATGASDNSDGAGERRQEQAAVVTERASDGATIAGERQEERSAVEAERMSGGAVYSW